MLEPYRIGAYLDHISLVVERTILDHTTTEVRDQVLGIKQELIRRLVIDEPR